MKISISECQSKRASASVRAKCISECQSKRVSVSVRAKGQQWLCKQKSISGCKRKGISACSCAKAVDNVLVDLDPHMK